MICFRDLKFATLVLSFLSLCFVLVVASSLSASSLNVSSLSAQDNNLLPSPDSKELKKATASIRKLLAEQYRDSSPEGRVELLKLLQKTADESLNDSVNHFALLSELVYAAAVFGDAATGWSACDEIESKYQVEDPVRIDFIKKIKVNLDEESAITLREKGLQLTKAQISADRFKEAGNLAKSLTTTLRPLTGSDPELGRLLERAKLLGRKFKQIQDDLAILADDPMNTKANGKVGEFYCLAKNDFETGLPYLAKGPPGSIRDLANDDLSLSNPSTEGTVAIADRWWDLATSEKQTGFQPRAVEKYRTIAGKLSGLAKIRAEGRIKESDRANFPSESTVAQLTSNNWRIEWEDDRFFKSAYLTPAHFFLLTDTGHSYEWEFRVNVDGVETWDARKGYIYFFSYRDGQLLAVKTRTLTKKKTSGVGRRISGR